MKTSCNQPIVKRWDATGDDGTSRFSIVLLRIMTTVFLFGTLYAIFLLSGLVDIFNWPMRLQILQMVVGIVLCFVLAGLWAAISIHPRSGPPPKALKITFYIGYIILMAQMFGFFPELPISPLLLCFTLPLIVAAVSFIPITRFAWTGKLS